MTDVDDLIKRLEEASEGSEALDIEISETLRPKGGPNVIIGDCYTRSLDAALPGERLLWLYGPIMPGDKWIVRVAIGEGRGEARANTEALARRIAALRARKALGS